MARRRNSATQRIVNRNTGVSRMTSGAAKKSANKIGTAMRRKSRGGQGG